MTSPAGEQPVEPKPAGSGLVGEQGPRPAPGELADHPPDRMLLGADAAVIQNDGAKIRGHMGHANRILVNVQSHKHGVIVGHADLGMGKEISNLSCCCCGSGTAPILENGPAEVSAPACGSYTV